MVEWVCFKDGGGVEMAYLEKKIWEEYNYTLLSEDEILKHLVRFVNSRNFEIKKYEIENAWTLILQEAQNLPSGSLRDGATKAANYLIKIVMDKETSFTPKKTTVSKKFFENGFREERELFHYK